MSRVVVFGHGPMRWETSNRLFALALRTWHFASTLARGGHDVLLFAIRGHAFEGWPHDKVARVQRGRVSVWSVSEHLCHERGDFIRERIDAFAPDCLVGVNRDPAAIAVNFAEQRPFWADINGDPMAEAQVKAASLGANWNINEWYRTLVPVLARADRFSTCSRAQRHALIAQLGMLGRLTAKNDGYDFVSAIPNSIDDEELDLLGRLPRVPRSPGEPFTVLWSGGYNTWTEPDVLFEALELAMDDAPELRFVSTGGGIAGHHTDAYQRFETRVARSRHKKRYELAGWVQTAELPAYYAGAHAAILVDRFSYEGTLGARTRMLDWLAAGLPIVSTRLSEISLDVERAGAAILADCGDARGLAEGLLELCRDPAAARTRGERGREFAHEVCRAERQLEPLTAWASAPTRPPDLEHRVALDWRPGLAVAARKQATLVRSELRQHGASATLGKAGRLGLRKLRHGAERVANRLGLVETSELGAEADALEAPPLEAPRLAAFQWRERLAALAPRPEVAIALLVDASTELHVLDWTLKQLELQYLEGWKLVVASLGALDQPLEALLEAATVRLGTRRAELVRADRVDLGEHRRLRNADHVLLLGAGTLLRPDALAELVSTARAESADVVYGRERVVGASGVPAPAREKPGFSPDLLLCRPYLGPAVLYSGQAFALSPEHALDWPVDALLYDCALRASERATKVVHVPHVVCQVWERPLSEAELVEKTRRRHAAELAAARDALFRRRVDASVEPGVSPGSLRVRCPVPEGNTLVVVPESASRRSLERALRSLRRHTKRSGVEIVSLRSPADLHSLEPGARWLVWVEPTLEALHDDWLECLLGELAYPGTVAVSPRLVNESGASLYAGDGSGTAADDYYWDVARRIAAPHVSCFAATRAALADVELPFEPSALRDVLESRARAWTERGQGVRYTPHTAFCLHSENGGGKPMARPARRPPEPGRASRKA